MHRFHLPPEQCQGRVVTLREDEAHHALHVLRLQRGEQVMVLDGVGSRLLCEVRSLSRDAVEMALAKKEFLPPLPYRITLLQAIPKGKTFDTIVQKATELGTWRIIPLLSERVVTRLDDGQASSKVSHWRRTAIEALKQCGSAWLPQVEPPLKPKEFLARQEDCELPLVASLQADSQHPRTAFRGFQAQHRRLPQTVCIWIGPEGDFTDDEYRDIRAGGALPITLGRLVLRTDTAAAYCLSVLNYELAAGPD